MKLSKCHFFSKEIQYLGHILTTIPKQVHAFLGLVGYFTKFIKDFAKIAKPLTLLT